MAPNPKNDDDDRVLLVEDEDCSGLTEDNSETLPADADAENGLGEADVRGPAVSPLFVVLGIGLVIAAGFTFTASNIIQKFYVPTLTFWQLLLHRSIVQTSLMFFVCAVQGARHRRGPAEVLLGPPGVRSRTVLQGILGGVLLLCMFNAIKHVPLGNSSAIMFCTPVFTFFFAPCMLRERCGLYRSLIALLMIGGVTLITRPQFVFGPNEATDGNATNATDGVFVVPDIAGASQELLLSLGYVCAVCVPLLSALISVLTRQCKHVPPYVLMFWFGAGGLLVSSLSVVAFRPDHLFNLTEVEWLSTLVIIVFGMIGNVCYTVAVRWVSPSKANVFRSFEVILNFILQLHFEHTGFFPENAVGMVFLVSAVVIMAYENDVIKTFGHRRFV